LKLAEQHLRPLSVLSSSAMPARNEDFCRNSPRRSQRPDLAAIAELLIERPTASSAASPS